MKASTPRKTWAKWPAIWPTARWFVLRCSCGLHSVLGCRNMGKTTGRLEGTLQRWQGSLTRVDVNVQHFSHNDDERLTATLIGDTLIMGIIGAFVVQILLSELFGVSLEKSVIPVWTVAAIVTLKGIKDTLSPKIRITQVTAQQDVAALTAILANVFDEHDLQWINP